MNDRLSPKKGCASQRDSSQEISAAEGRVVWIWSCKAATSAWTQALDFRVLIMKLVMKQPQFIQTIVALLTRGKFRYRFYSRKELTLSTVQTVLHLSGLPKQDLHNGNTSLHATRIEEISQSPTPVWKPQATNGCWERRISFLQGHAARPIGYPVPVVNPQQHPCNAKWMIDR